MRTITGKLLSTFLLVFAVTLVDACSDTEQRSSSNTNNTQNQMTAPEAAAKKALETLPALVNNENFSAMGFGSVDEARAATLGTPTRRRTVGYDKLLNYQPGTPLTQLFEGGREEFVYPVLVGQNAKTSIVVAGSAGNWQISSLGDRYLANIISSARQTLPVSPAATPTPVPTQPDGGVELISIPGINLDLLSFSEGNQMMLQPTRDLPEAQLVRGRAVKAEDALLAISNYVKEFDRKYGDEIRKRRLVN